MAKTANTPKPEKVVDVKRSPAKAAAIGETQRYRVLRPILHGKTHLAVNDLVDMTDAQAGHLVETGALVLHYVPQTVSRVVNLGNGKPVEEGLQVNEVTGLETAAAVDAPGAIAPDSTVGPE